MAIKEFKTVILSVGGIPTKDIDFLVKNKLEKYSDKLYLIYGFQAEPTPINQNNLHKLQLLKERYNGFKIGFMDHSDGASEQAHYLPLLAVGAGVEIIEKHLTLDRCLELEDYVSALDSTSFKDFVKLIRTYEVAMGSKSLNLTDIEKEYFKKAVKVAIAERNLKKGTKLDSSNVLFKRTSKQASEDNVVKISDLIGKTLKSACDQNNPILWSNLCEN